jgi:predicted flap endonuclease-1-like 5' DNA nuclease
MSIEIAHIKLSNPAQRAFQSAGILTLEQLAEHTEAEIAALHGAGPKVMHILRETLGENGLAFASPKQTS